MSRKLLLLNAGLLAIAVYLGIAFRDHLREARAHQADVLARTGAASATVIPPPAVPTVSAVPALNYSGVAEHTLFSADRNPNRIIDPPPPIPPPPPPPPEPPVPAMPVYYGQMAFGEPVIVLSEGSKRQKGYHAGEQVGDFTIAAFDRTTVTLAWRDKTLVKDLAELATKEKPGTKSAGPASAAASKSAPTPGKTIMLTNDQVQNPGRSASADAGARPSVVSKLGEGKSSGNGFGDNGKAPEPILGGEFGEGRSCALEDKSPAGTVSGGFRKVINQGMMGPVCFWEPVK